MLKSAVAGFAAVFASLAAAPVASADESPVLVELFTSQSCSSCIMAAEYFEALTDREDVVALAWHVDYWNALETRKGRWVDPFSSAENTERQRQYNRRLRTTNAVYTPQLVVNGAAECTGSSKGKADMMINAAQETAVPLIQDISIADDRVRFSVSDNADATVVYFKEQMDTQVLSGENAGRLISNRHIVTGMDYVSAAEHSVWREAKAPAENERCAILLQAPDQGEVLAARYCPEQ